MTGIYLRVSTHDQSDSSQHREVLAFAQRAGWHDLEIYRDQISGATRNRPELDRLLKDARSGKIDRILCYKMDRIGRSVLHLSQLLSELKMLKVPIFFTSQGISTEKSNPAADLFLNILMSVAEFERGIISERIRAGIHARMASGKPMGRPAISDAVLAAIASEKNKGHSLRSIAKTVGVSLGTVHKVVTA